LGAQVILPRLCRLAATIADKGQEPNDFQKTTARGCGHCRPCCIGDIAA
jgi:hypothetical protein